LVLRQKIRHDKSIKNLPVIICLGR
jgi:hypothetical protein